MTIPIIKMDERLAHDAFEAHCALVRAEKRDPTLARNEHWRALRDTALARFLAAFEVL